MLEQGHGSGTPHRAASTPFVFDKAGLDLLWAAADKCARCAGLSREDAEDLAQNTSMELSRAIAAGSTPSRGEAEEFVSKHAMAMRDKGRKDKRRLCVLARESPADRSGLPTLCPRLSGLTDVHPRPGDFRKRVMATALLFARLPKTLNAEQFRLFYFCWIESMRCTQIAELLGISPRAVAQRARRISSKIETRIVDALRTHLSPSEWTRIRDLVGSNGSEHGLSLRMADVAFRSMEVILGEGQRTASESHAATRRGCRNSLPQRH